MQLKQHRLLAAGVVLAALTVGCGSANPGGLASKSTPVDGTQNSGPVSRAAACGELTSPTVNEAGFVASVSSLSLENGPEERYNGPDVTNRAGYSLRSADGSRQTIDTGIAMLHLFTSTGEPVSSPSGVEAIGVRIDIPSGGVAIAPFVWNSIDCRTNASIAPGNYQGYLTTDAFGWPVDITVVP